MTDKHSFPCSALADKQISIYTDGACSGNPGPGGYGIVMICGQHRKELSGGFANTTNNRMELFSVICALRAVKSTEAAITVYSDSRYVVDMYNHGHAQRWKRHGWTRNKGKNPALNADLWDELLTLGARLSARFVWVRGHAEHKENERCDQLAVEARMKSDLPEDQGYTTPKTPDQPEQLPLFAML
ncbi:MAG: ribonuclease HI [Spartobacteria bacterium]|nr:ribonuclease HI [Spartobacteria bacterium]